MNSVIFVSDLAGGIVPEWERGKPILSTSSCISVICYPEQDGSTQIALGTKSEIDPRTPAAYEGMLETPHRAVIIHTVDRQVLLKSAVRGDRTRIAIWLSDPRWPERVTIGLD
jgi:hypothetical protein